MTGVIFGKSQEDEALDLGTGQLEFGWHLTAPFPFLHSSFFQFLASLSSKQLSIVSSS